MAFERFRQEREVEAQRKAVLEEQERVERKAADIASQLASDKAAKILAEKNKRTKTFLDDSGLRSKLNEFRVLIGKGTIQGGAPYRDWSVHPTRDKTHVFAINPDLRYSHYGEYRVFFPRRDLLSFVDVMGWRTREPNGYMTRQDYDSCLVAETCTDGTIMIHGDVVPGIKRGLFRRGREGVNGSTIIPESDWRNNPVIFEDALLKAYRYPIHLPVVIYPEPDRGE